MILVQKDTKGRKGVFRNLSKMYAVVLLQDSPLDSYFL